MNPNYIWKINDLEIEFDLQDLEVTQRYEEAFEKMAEDEKNSPKEGKTSDKILAYYNVFVSLYDRLFGEGMGKRILGEKVNVRVCNEVYDSFLEFVKAQRAELTETVQNWQNKYSSNRAQRRISGKRG